MGRRSKSLRQREINKQRNRKRNKVRNSDTYQFHKNNWKLEKKISTFVKYRKKIPNFIQEKSKMCVVLAKNKNEYLPNEKSYGKPKGSYIRCAAASKDEAFYYLHKQKKHVDSKVYEEPTNISKFANKCTTWVVYKPKIKHETSDVRKQCKICYHNKLPHTCEFANRNINKQ